MRRFAILALIAQMVAASSYLPPQPLTTVPLTSVQYAKTDWAAVLGTYVRFCQTTALPKYYVDCLSERFAFTAAAMDANNPDTAQLRQTLAATSRDLYAIATKYHTPEAGEARPKSGRIAATRPLRAIAPQNRAAAIAAGTRALETTELVLLRSAERDPAQSLAFRQVAEVIGTAKVLLRSA